jgi:hypothetical protein
MSKRFEKVRILREILPKRINLESARSQRDDKRGVHRKNRFSPKLDPEFTSKTLFNVNATVVG